MTQMQREIDVLRATEQTFRKKTLELELDNDDLERTERLESVPKLWLAACADINYLTELRNRPLQTSK
jgi:hypothetical protein